MNWGAFLLKVFLEYSLQSTGKIWTEVFVEKRCLSAGNFFQFSTSLKFQFLLKSVLVSLHFYKKILCFLCVF